MLEVKNLIVKYGGITAIQGISLSIPRRQIVAMVGANGAGKSTTINAISGMVRKTSGDIVYEGKSLPTRPHEVSRMGIVQVPEGRKIFPTISVEENLILGAYVVKDPLVLKQNLERVYSLFPVLKARRRQGGGTLSGGEQQMLAFGRALMSNPNILLLDEPSLGLAPKLIIEIFQFIEKLKQEGLTILLVEQNATKALSIADYAYVLETGRIVAEGSGKELLANPIIRKAYLGCLDDPE